MRFAKQTLPRVEKQYPSLITKTPMKDLEKKRHTFRKRHSGSASTMFVRREGSKNENHAYTKCYTRMIRLGPIFRSSIECLLSNYGPFT
jgi:hypothetical protein